MLKHFVLLLLVPVLLVSCQDREREKTMAEIERLDLLRKKVNEFLLGQKASLLSKKLEYANWKSGHLANLTKYKKTIERIERRIESLEVLIRINNKFIKDGKPFSRESFKKNNEKYKKQIQSFQRYLHPFREAHKNTKQELAEKEPIFLSQIVALEADLRISQATYDSLNTLHTTEVGKLVKFGGEQ